MCGRRKLKPGPKPNSTSATNRFQQRPPAVHGRQARPSIGLVGDPKSYTKEAVSLSCTRSAQQIRLFMALLNCVILNSNRHSSHPTSMLCHASRLEPMPKGTGSFTLQWDRDTQLHLIRAEGHAVLAHKQGATATALAFLAWGTAESEIGWAELGQQHDQILRALNRPLIARIRPPALPWLAISFAPQFFDPAPAAQVHQVVSSLTTAAQLLLEQELPCTPPCLPDRGARVGTSHRDLSVSGI